MCYRHEAALVDSALAPSDARTIVRRLCHELHVEDVTDTAALLTSELVTNAVQHAAGPLRLGVSCAHGRLVVSVSDADPQQPRPRRAGAHEGGGRGLAIVAALADRWGSRSLPDDGKAVWFALRPDGSGALRDGCGCADASVDEGVAPTEPGSAEPRTRIPASRRGS
ncbi:MAG: ATP-binding protein [Actinomycetes bacterium]